MRQRTQLEEAGGRATHLGFLVFFFGTLGVFNIVKPLYKRKKKNSTRNRTVINRIFAFYTP